MLRYTLLILNIALFLAPSSAWALVSPVGVSIVPPVEFPLRSGSVVGVRLNLIYGIHSSVYGFDFGTIGNMTDRSFGGIQVAGGFNRNKGPAHIFGAQIAGLFNWNVKDGTIVGLQATAGLNYNRGKKISVIGLGLGVIGNYTEAKAIGMQLGLYNYAGELFGLQIGLINVAKALHGIQIGLVNINKTGWLPFFPVVNIGF